ncbi:hypothetical protein niasHT_002342 [Heterodera trifolii]|uniref:Uncharacterized protein n=1 Tax=Heterodera trifolii TaxID=157864 RepID=A0ABD2LM70_9BILA
MYNKLKLKFKSDIKRNRSKRWTPEARRNRMDHELVAPEDTSGVTKAKDANMKDSNMEWYPSDDPRNLLNVRRRTQGGTMPDLFKSAEPMALP